MIYAVVPAWNEAKTIASTIASLRAQTRPPDLIVVVPNNCTDRTAAVAREEGAYVVEVPGHNPYKKAGAINYALDRIAPYLDHWAKASAVLIMDADTTLDPDFVAVAERHLCPGVGGVGGTFVGREAHNIIGQCQRMEFFRYGRITQRFGYRAFVLTGTGTLFDWPALKAVRAARLAGRVLPCGKSYYDTRSLTEDNELTLALQTIGYLSTSPEGMGATTDIMDTPKKLIKQRERWYLGALRNLNDYGSRLPWHLRWVYWRQQAGLLLSAFVIGTYLLMLATTYLTGRSLSWSWWWAIPTGVLIVERTASVWPMGWRERLLAATFIPEQLYVGFLTYVYLRAALLFARGSRGGWTAT
ncbi:MAG: glycosyltransferase family 2 protein [Dactylosporangium sp.]|nr:glycosyltransferase family 2 protein [Dactylosporangium sp.]NNJ61377.1 glycosyltransferase family 2 protein [Dactylosporangium sp.]